MASVLKLAERYWLPPSGPWRLSSVGLGATMRNTARSEGREPHDQLGNEADSAEADRVHAVQGLGGAEVLRV